MTRPPGRSMSYAKERSFTAMSWQFVQGGGGLGVLGPMGTYDPWIMGLEYLNNIWYLHNILAAGLI